MYTRSKSTACDTTSRNDGSSAELVGNEGISSSESTAELRGLQRDIGKPREEGSRGKRCSLRKVSTEDRLLMREEREPECDGSRTTVNLCSAMPARSVVVETETIAGCCSNRVM